MSPFGLLILGTVGKGIIRGGVDRFIFYLGFDASLTALYAGVVYLFDVAHDPTLRNENKIDVTGAFLIVALVLFFVIVMCHMIWEKEENRDKVFSQVLVLGVFANIIGFGLLVVFVLLVKGV